MRRAKFRVFATLDRSQLQEGVVTINRNNGTIAVRPLRRKREYILPLAKVAEIIVARVIKAEVFAERLARKKGKR